MEEQITHLEPLLEKAEQYGKTSFNLFKLKVLEKTTDLASECISRSFVILFFCMFMLSLTVGASLWLGDLLGKSCYGFFCVAGFYAIVGVVLYFAMHNWMKKNIANNIISQVLK